MNGICAYCSKQAQLTREHIIPSFVYAANPLAKFGYNPRARQFIHWEAQIKDVCARCNNELLSIVDGYAKRFCVANRIDLLVTTEKTFQFTYDWSWLCRFLLKVTFNSMRARGN